MKKKKQHTCLLCLFCFSLIPNLHFLKTYAIFDSNSVEWMKATNMICIKAKREKKHRINVKHIFPCKHQIRIFGIHMLSIRKKNLRNIRWINETRLRNVNWLFVWQNTDYFRKVIFPPKIFIFEQSHFSCRGSFTLVSIWLC